MFSKLKNRIKELAKTAVFLAEEQLSQESGQRKKNMAIEFIISNLPIPSIFRKLIANLLNAFIDEAIEFSVVQMKTFSQKQ